MLLRLFLAGLGLIAGTLAVLALLSTSSATYPGVVLIFQCLLFFAVLPTVMGLFISLAPEDAGRKVAEREIREAYYKRF